MQRMVVPRNDVRVSKAKAAPLFHEVTAAILLLTYLVFGVPGMSSPERLTTIVSTKGKVILPKAMRRMLRWEAGTRGWSR